MRTKPLTAISWRAIRWRGALGPYLVHASAEAAPLPDGSFDIVFCDHGAMTWADPLAAVPEAARLLRPGGLLACWNGKTDCVDAALHENDFEQHKADDGSAVCFSLPYGRWIALFRQSGFIVEDLIELRAPLDGQSTYRDFVSREWARKWPAEQIWRVRKAT